MMNGMSTAGATVPPVGTVQVVPGQVVGTGPRVPGATTGAEAEQERLLRQLIATLTQLIAIATAQAGAAGVAGGGGQVAPAPQAQAVTAESLRMAVAGGSLGGGASWHGAYTLEAASAAPALAGVVGGGGGGSGPAGIAGPPSTSVGGSGTGPAWSVVAASGAPVPLEGALGAPAAPQAGQPAGMVSGGGAAAPQVDMRRVSGSPQPGGLVDVVLRSASTAAGASRSDGAWTVLTDAAGAQLQAHVHGAWASNPGRILEGIQRGYVAVHLHADGTLHLHDVIGT